MSLWRKRGTSDTIAPFARHDGQNTPKLFTMPAMTDNDLSIKSEDLSIKSEPYKSTRQELREQIEGLERDYDLLLTKYKLLLAEKSPEVKESLTTEPVAYINIEKRKLEWAHDYMSWDTPTVVNLPRIPLYTTLQPAPQGEPVAWMFQHEETGRIMFVEAQQLEYGFEEGNPRLKKISPLYATPPQRTWVGLTEDERYKLWLTTPSETENRFAFAKAIEQALKERNI
jgi:hypothetical protein